jgi:hypothetical protein
VFTVLPAVFWCWPSALNEPLSRVVGTDAGTRYHQDTREMTVTLPPGIRSGANLVAKGDGHEVLHHMPGTGVEGWGR